MPHQLLQAAPAGDESQATATVTSTEPMTVSMGIGDGLKKETQAWVRTVLQIGAMGCIAWWFQGLLGDMRADRKWDREQAVKTQELHTRQYEAATEGNDRRIESLREADHIRTEKLVGALEKQGEKLDAVREAVRDNTRAVERLGKGTGNQWPAVVPRVMPGPASIYRVKEMAPEPRHLGE